jgi:hypothetical protein
LRSAWARQFGAPPRRTISRCAPPRKMAETTTPPSRGARSRVRTRLQARGAENTRRGRPGPVPKRRPREPCARKTAEDRPRITGATAFQLSGSATGSTTSLSRPTCPRKRVLVPTQGLPHRRLAYLAGGISVMSARRWRADPRVGFIAPVIRGRRYHCKANIEDFVDRRVEPTEGGAATASRP